MLNLNYNLNAANIERARFTEQENESFRPFQIQYILVPGGGGAAAGNYVPAENYSGSIKPVYGIAGNAGSVVTGSYCVQPFITYPIVIGNGGTGGQISDTLASFSGSNGGDTSFFNITAIGGEGGKSQIYITSSTAAGNGSQTSASISSGGSGSQWTYNLPGCLPGPFNPGCHGGELISSSYYGGGGAGFIVNGVFNPLTVEYLFIGAGGSAAGGTTNGTGYNQGIANGGGGGAFISGSFQLEPTIGLYTLTVGKGGVCTNNTSSGSRGGDTYGFGIRAGGGEGATADKGGNSGTGSWLQTSAYIGANAKTTGAPNIYAGGGAGSSQNGQDGGNGFSGKGGSGSLWLDGGYYAAGGGGAKNATGAEQAADGFSYNPWGKYAFGQGGNGFYAGSPSASIDGSDGGIILRYPGSGSKLTGGEIYYSGSYTYHLFYNWGTYNVTLDNTPTWTTGIPGIGAGSNTNTNAQSNGGGSAGASLYNTSGSNGGSGFVAIRYEGAPLAEGGNIVVTDHYTYHLFSSSGDFYVIGQESNPNINPCP